MMMMMIKIIILMKIANRRMRQKRIRAKIINQQKRKRDNKNSCEFYQLNQCYRSKKNITIYDILKLEGDRDVIMKRTFNVKDQLQQQRKLMLDQDEEEEGEGNQQEELALGADNGGDYEEQASYFIKNQNIALSETNDLKNLPSPQNNNRIDSNIEKIQAKQQQSSASKIQKLQFTCKQNQSQLSQKSTRQGNDQKITTTSPLQLAVQEEQIVSKKKKKKQNAKVNYFLQDQAQLGSDNQQHDNVCYRDNFGDQEDQEDDQDDQDLKDLIDNTNNINDNDQIQVKNRMDLYLKNQQRDQELDNQKILDLVMGKKREEQSSRANAETNRKLDFLIKMQTDQYNKEQEKRKRAQAQLNQYFQKEMKQNGGGDCWQEDGQNSDFENERQNQIENRKLQLNARMSKIASKISRISTTKGLIRDLSQFNGNAQFSIKMNNKGFNPRKTQLKINMPNEPISLPLKIRQKSLSSIMIQKQKFNRTQNIIQKMRINAGIKQNNQQVERAKKQVMCNSIKGKSFNLADSKRKKNKAEKGNKLLEFKP